jgi:hypothetical protein
VSILLYKASDLIFQTSVNVPKGHLINYQNTDGGDNFNIHLVILIESNILFYQSMINLVKQ